MTLEIYHIIVLNIIIFIIGYVLGKISHRDNTHYINTNNKPNIFNKQLATNTNISIDEKKVVTKIDTNMLEKKYEELGKTTISDDNISESINKLKRLKK
jgi:hypothetical protein